MKLDSAVFYSNDLIITIPFYRDTLGLEVNYIQENRFASFNFENSKLGIKQKKKKEKFQVIKQFL